MKLYDITRPLNNQTAYWPGDTPFHLEMCATIPDGDGVNLSKITSSPHVGTHVDAPYHYDQQGDRMAAVPLERYFGPARVIEIGSALAVSASHLQAIDLKGVERLLIRTGSCVDPTRFDPGYAYLEPDAVTYAASMGVGLIGIDTYSVDPFESRELPAHHACRSAGILILENINLDAVPCGEYELIALPLRLTDAEASPVRAILRAVS